jgi:RNA polymerase sigma factor (sigma-70 family)
MRLTPEQQRTVESLIPDAERIAQSICHRWNDDIRSTAYMALCDAVATHDGSKSVITSWVYTKVRRALQTEWRAERRHDHHHINKSNEPAVYDDDTVVVEDLLRTLPAKYREIFREVVLRGSTLELLSTRTGVSKQRIHQIVRSCNTRLRSKLSWMQEVYSRSAKESTMPLPSLPEETGEMGQAS